ncbi:MAG: C4-dicarboxylate transporter DcuC [Gemmataceae bacterium]|nr:C4-dicarboxylate transporter DcuC [Gemmataceae bacterium]MCS7269561.1 C4-dicarboxylate transporter DcuC [Gemmataceae bacterium]MDW8242512.1 C4-dicarboxylate transporter DcuC [Thermogemmata sp.]
MESGSLAALLIAAVAALLILRGWDVRLVLLGAALLLGALTNELPRVVRTFLSTLANEKFVVPICSAMGFAYVLRHTGCDQQLVYLLLRPLRPVRGLLIPGVIVVAFVVNVPVISQTSTAACVGPVALPLLRAAGYSAATAGACLLLGASVGGELLNPGAPELLTIAAANPDHPLAPPTLQVRTTLPPVVLTQLVVALVVCWLLSRWWWPAASEAEASPQSRPPPPLARHRWLPAVVPLVPLLLLLAVGPPFALFEVPEQWLVAASPEGRRDPAYHTRLIGLAMLVGVVVAAIAVPACAKDCMRLFFEGAGYGLAQIVSLIVTAHCFGTAMEAAGLARDLGRLLQAVPELLVPLAAGIPLLFAVLCGSGMASTQSLYGFFQEPALALGIDPVALGALTAVGSAAGRTMSPVAAVTLLCAQLTGTPPLVLARRVCVPLLAGITVVVALRLLEWL